MGSFFYFRMNYTRMKNNELISSIRPYFSDLPDNELREFLAISKLKTYDNKTVILKS